VWFLLVYTYLYCTAIALWGCFYVSVWFLLVYTYLYYTAIALCGCFYVSVWSLLVSTALQVNTGPQPPEGVFFLCGCFPSRPRHAE